MATTSRTVTAYGARRLRRHRRRPQVWWGSAAAWMFHRQTETTASAGPRSRIEDDDVNSGARQRGEQGWGGLRQRRAPRPPMSSDPMPEPLGATAAEHRRRRSKWCGLRRRERPRRKRKVGKGGRDAASGRRQLLRHIAFRFPRAPRRQRGSSGGRQGAPYIRGDDHVARTGCWAPERSLSPLLWGRRPAMSDKRPPHPLRDGKGSQPHGRDVPCRRVLRLAAGRGRPWQWAVAWPAAHTARWPRAACKKSLRGRTVRRAPRWSAVPQRSQRRPLTTARRHLRGARNRKTRPPHMTTMTGKTRPASPVLTQRPDWWRARKCDGCSTNAAVADATTTAAQSYGSAGFGNRRQGPRLAPGGKRPMRPTEEDRGTLRHVPRKDIVR